MKSRIIATVVFSILTLLCIAMCIFAACYPMGVPSIGNPIKVSDKIQVKNVDGEPVISGKIKNTTDDGITLEGSQCLVISLYNPRSGWNYLHISSQDFTIEAKKELDLSTISLKISDEDYEYLKATYTWGYTYVVDSVTVYTQNYGPDPILIYERILIEEGQVYLTLFVILAVVFASIAILIILPYILSKTRYTASKRRLDLAKSQLAQIGGAVYLRGAFCQKKSMVIKPSLFSKIKGNFKALTMGVIINTRYQNAEVMDFVITQRGFYVAPAKSKAIDVKDMEFFDKEDLGGARIWAFKDNVVINSLSGVSYFVFDLSQKAMTANALTDLLNQMFEDNDDIQHVDFDENTAQKNI